jgi:hypothetical protein
VPVHEHARHVLRPLIDRARGEDDREIGQSDEQADVAAERHVVSGRVADVRAHRRFAVAVDDATEELLAARERFRPRGLAPRLAVADHRHAQPVGVFVQMAEHRALRADEAFAPHVGVVRADARDLALFYAYLEAAHCFAERARAVVDLLFHAQGLI